VRRLTNGEPEETVDGGDATSDARPPTRARGATPCGSCTTRITPAREPCVSRGTHGTNRCADYRRLPRARFRRTPVLQPASCRRRGRSRSPGRPRRCAAPAEQPHSRTVVSSARSRDHPLTLEKVWCTNPQVCLSPDSLSETSALSMARTRGASPRSTRTVTDRRLDAITRASGRRGPERDRSPGILRPQNRRQGGVLDLCAAQVGRGPVVRRVWRGGKLRQPVSQRLAPHRPLSRARWIDVTTKDEKRSRRARRRHISKS
jgi:hypothetical protein